MGQARMKIRLGSQIFLGGRVVVGWDNMLDVRRKSLVSWHRVSAAQPTRSRSCKIRHPFKDTHLHHRGRARLIEVPYS